MDEALPDLSEPTRWRRNGWTATVVKNLDDDGWAVEMTRVGAEEPSLVGPWTMGRDKKNPKPLDLPAFQTLVKTANEVVRRHEQAEHARLHKSFRYTRADGTNVLATLDVVPDEDDPHAILRCVVAETGEAISDGRVPANARLDARTVDRFLANGEL